MLAKMLLKSATLLCLFALTHSATVRQRNIPVEVKYDDATTSTDENTVNEVTEASEIIRLSPEKQQYAVKNLDEKVQLAPDDLTEILKHLPAEEEISLDELRAAQSEQLTLETNIQNALQQAEDVIYGGLKKLKTSFKGDKDQKMPNSQQWEDFEKTVNEFLSEQKIKLQLKQEQPAQPPQNQNIFQSIAQGFQTIANNFVQNLSGSQNTNENSTGQGDEQQGGQAQGPFQGFINFFQNGVNNLVGSINGLGGQGSTTTNTVLGDPGTATTQTPGFVSNLVNNVQQFFGQIQGAAQGGGPSGTQGDPGNGTTPTSPQGPGQIIQSIGSAINQIIQGRPPNTAGDEGTGTTQASTNIIQSIGNVIQNSPLNPFRPPQKPAEGDSTTSNPIQAGISGVQNIGSQIQQLIPGQGSTTEAAKMQEQVTNSQSTQSAVELNGDNVQEQAKEIVLDEVRKEQPIQEIIQQTELPETTSQAQVSEEVQEETKGEEVTQQMEEQVKKEEIKEEFRQQEIRGEVENNKKEMESNKEILVSVE